MTRDFAIAGLFAVLAAILPAALALAPKPGAPVAVIAFPWADDGAALRIVAAAQGDLIAAPRHGGIAIATSLAADFVARLYGAGAALVIDGAVLAGCLPGANAH